mmetsp:Transcript_9833/g.19036  ORF Transcript_9833/g.19036 Transcript_9833/m.19036 type:complete len:160 (-) Transcript_9833:1016-1495(-)
MAITLCLTHAYTPSSLRVEIKIPSDQSCVNCEAETPIYLLFSPSDLIVNQQAFVVSSRVCVPFYSGVSLSVVMQESVQAGLCIASLGKKFSRTPRRKKEKEIKRKSFVHCLWSCIFSPFPSLFAPFPTSGPSSIGSTLPALLFRFMYRYACYVVLSFLK